MRVLVLGGTRFIGTFLVETLLQAGDEVTLFHRGITNKGLFAEAEHLLGDRNGDLDLLEGRSWDATVDFSAYLPFQVRSLAAALRGRGGRYVYVSSVSAYATPRAAGLAEDSPLQKLEDPQATESIPRNYGAGKAECEITAAQTFGKTGGLSIVRPTYVAGPRDYTARFTWWVERVAAGGAILAPGPESNPFQVIDARDLASFMAMLVHGEAEGVFNTAGPKEPITFAGMLDEIAACVAPANTSFHWVSAADLREAGVGSGSNFPLWHGEDPSRLVLSADTSRALAAGLTLRPLAATINDIHAVERNAHTIERAGIGLEKSLERELLAKLA